ncbi:hypothetical protein [Catenulispora sp. GAS73]|uniref:hypothetical protein n=1 Tax=Catenulispora sp. GAS73 TaxID=3156269 RepID=UPI003517292B
MAVYDPPEPAGGVEGDDDPDVAIMLRLRVWVVWDPVEPEVVAGCHCGITGWVPDGFEARFVPLTELVLDKVVFGGVQSWCFLYVAAAAIGPLTIPAINETTNIQATRAIRRFLIAFERAVFRPQAPIVPPHLSPLARPTVDMPSAGTLGSNC